VASSWLNSFGAMNPRQDDPQVASKRATLAVLDISLQLQAACHFRAAEEEKLEIERKVFV